MKMKLLSSREIKMCVDVCYTPLASGLISSSVFVFFSMISPSLAFFCLLPRLFLNCFFFLFLFLPLFLCVFLSFLSKYINSLADSQIHIFADTNLLPTKLTKIRFITLPTATNSSSYKTYRKKLHEDTEHLYMLLH